MYESDTYLVQENPTFLPKDRKVCAFIADIVSIQCVVVFLGAATILYCTWSPEKATLDYDKLTRIMYLFDSDACGYKLHVAKDIANLQINNDTFGLDILPIKYQPAIVAVSTLLSAKTRKYIETSVVIHAIWFMLSLAFRIFAKNSTDIRTLKVALAVYFYACLCVIGFDLSMAVVYVTHIKQSLTKNMILRYSGWSTEIELESGEDFAGWLPVAASACWLRGFVIFIMNVYFCKVINYIRRKIKRREFRMRNPNENYVPIPEPRHTDELTDDILVYRVGENAPQTSKNKVNTYY